jgi:hypothetical protein
MSRVRKFIRSLFSRKKNTGTAALTKTLLDMARVVDELDNTLMEANIEADLQNDRVKAAQNEMRSIEDLIDKGDAFLTGLKGLFGITD